MILSARNTHVKIIKALALTVQRFITKLKFQTDLQNDGMTE